MIKADVLYDKNALSGLMKFNAVDRPWKWAAYILVTLLVTIWLIMNIGRDFFAFYLIILILVAAIDFLVVYAYFIMPKVRLKNFSADKEVMNHFTFTDEAIKISSESKERKGSSEIKYEMIFKACESKDAFYLFVNKRGALIILKDSITEGTVDDLKSLLNAKINDKKRNKLIKK